MSERFQNEKLYRSLCEPFPSVDAANAAFTEFQADLYALREKHRICELLFVAQIPVAYVEGDEGRQMVVGMFGDEHRMESMAGYAYGKSSSMRQARVARDVELACDAVRPAKNKK